MDRGAWWATYSLWGHKESEMADQLNTHNEYAHFIYKMCIYEHTGPFHVGNMNW